MGAFNHFLLISIYLHSYSALISDKRLCIDADCKTPISEAKTFHHYYAPEQYYLSFKPNEKVIIYSKSAGSNLDLWGAEIRGKRGYIPKNFVKETKILGEKPKILVDTEISVNLGLPKVPSEKENVKPTKVEENYEIVDGTTLYIQPELQDTVKDEEENVDKQSKINRDNIQVTDQPINSGDTSEQKDQTHQQIEKSVSSQEDSGYFSGLMGEMFGMTLEESEEIVKDTQPKMLNINEEGEIKSPEIKSHLTTPVSQEEEPSSDSIKLETNIPAGKNTSPETVENNSNQAPIESSEVENKSEENPDDSSKENNQQIEIDVSSPKISSELQNNESVQNSNMNSNEDPIESLNNEHQSDNSPTENDEKTEEDVSSPKTSSDLENNKVFPNSTVDPNEMLIEPPSDSISMQNLSETSVEDFPTQVGDTFKIDAEPLILNSTDQIANENSEQNLPKSFVQEIQRSVESDSISPKTEEAFIETDKTLENSTTEELRESEKISNSHTTKDDQFKQNSDLSSYLEQNLGNETILDEKEENTEKVFEKIGIVEDNKQIENDVEESSNETVGAILDSGSKLEASFDEITEKEGTNVINNKNDSNEKPPIEKVMPLYPSILKSAPLNEKIPAEYVDKHPQIVENVNGGVENGITESSKENSGSINNFRQENEYSEENDQKLFLDKVPVIADVIPEVHETEAPDITRNLGDTRKYEYDHTGHKTSGEASLETDEDKKGAEQFYPTPSSFSNEDSLGLPDVNEDVKKSFMDVRVNEGEACQQATTTLGDFSMELPNLSSDLFLYLLTTAISVIIFLMGYFVLDKNRREGPLIDKINRLEKELLVVIKEKEDAEEGMQPEDFVESQDYIDLKRQYEDIFEQKRNLEEQVQYLEKELENSTEVGLELNRMLSDMLSSENAGETLMSNIEGLQAQLAEQQGIVSTMKGKLSLKETENHELNLELDISNKKVVELQSELDKLLLNIIKIEEEKDYLEKSLNAEISNIKMSYSSLNTTLENREQEYTKEINRLKEELSISERNLQIKSNEYLGLKDSMQQIKDMKNANTLDSLLEVTSIKAELEQLKSECKSHCENLKREKELNMQLEKRVRESENEMDEFKRHFDEVDKSRLELETKLQVLTNYFKEKESQLLKEISKYENMWSAKQGEASSTSERIKYLQSEVQNYKSQNESLKQEIVSQEVELKGQISVLEKKVHENWVSARQAERRLEDLKQEAAQLRNRLTLRERALQEDKTHNRMQSPLEQNSDLMMSSLQLESPSSPPLLYSSRDHITKSPPIIGMPPPPFLPPPPPGAPFLPPPHLSFMPPPPDMFPGDHRPPPLGRMSSPPLNSRYSPDRRPYSPYERRSPSPSYDESEYGTSPVLHRRYSPFNGRKNHRRAPVAPMGKTNGGNLSSGSGNSNESLDEMNHFNSKV